MQQDPNDNRTEKRETPDRKGDKPGGASYEEREKPGRHDLREGESQRADAPGRGAASPQGKPQEDAQRGKSRDDDEKDRKLGR